MKLELVTRQLQRRRDAARAEHLHDSAVFWADKVLTLTNAVSDAYALADAFFSARQYSRAVTCLQANGRVQQSLACRNLAVRAFLELGKIDKAWEIIDDERLSITQIEPVKRRPLAIAHESVFQYLKGVVLLRKHRALQAKECFLAALRIDMYCYDAFNALLRNHLLSPAEERQLIRSSSFKTSRTPVHPDSDDGIIKESGNSDDDHEVVKLLYLIKTSKFGDTKEVTVAEQLLRDRYQLGANTDVQYSKAETYYAQGFVKQTYDLLRHILRFDIHNLDAIPLYARCMVDMREHNSLYNLGHDLVESYSNHPVSWYTVSCYYQSIGDTNLAKRYLFKATEKDDMFMPAWLSFLEISANDKEYDAALTAYAHASRAMPKSHLPKLYIARAYQNHGQLDVALEFYSQARELCKDDPIVCKEYGELLMWRKMYHEALEQLTMAKRLLYATSERTELLGQTYLSLSKVYAQINNSDQARSCVQQAIALLATSPEAFTRLADFYVIDGRLDDAIEYYHKALRINPENTKVTDKLNTILKKKQAPSSDSQSALPTYLVSLFGPDIDNNDWIPPVISTAEEGDSDDEEEFSSNTEHEGIPSLLGTRHSAIGHSTSDGEVKVRTPGVTSNVISFKREETAYRRHESTQPLSLSTTDTNIVTGNGGGGQIVRSTTAPPCGNTTPAAITLHHSNERLVTTRLAALTPSDGPASNTRRRAQLQQQIGRQQRQQNETESSGRNQSLLNSPITRQRARVYSREVVHMDLDEP